MVVSIVLVTMDLLVLALNAVMLTNVPMVKQYVTITQVVLILKVLSIVLAIKDGKMTDPALVSMSMSATILISTTATPIMVFASTRMVNSVVDAMMALKKHQTTVPSVLTLMNVLPMHITVLPPLPVTIMMVHLLAPAMQDLLVMVKIVNLVWLTNVVMVKLIAMNLQNVLIWIQVSSATVPLDMMVKVMVPKVVLTSMNVPMKI